jgi:signal transduction histidine kinase
VNSDETSRTDQDIIEEPRCQEELKRLVEERTRELHHAEAELVQSKKMAALGNLVAGIAHEINNPVGVVNSSIDIMGRCVDTLTQAIENPTDKREKRLAKCLKILKEHQMLVSHSTQRIIQTVRNLKTFARLDQSDFEHMNIHEGIESSLAMITHELKPRMQIVKRFGSIPPVPCYPKNLNQVFMHLLLNAAQSIDDEGTITITTWTDEGWVKVSIEDTGRGIPHEQMERIFDPGFTTKQVGVGTGLGLAIVYTIMEQHGGTIEISSQNGKGTTALLSLPRHKEL